MTHKEIIGQNIRYYRRNDFLTQKDLAEQIGITASYLANIENGQKSLGLNKLVELCVYLDIELSDLFPLKHRKVDTAKERLLCDILTLLRTWDADQLNLLKTMLFSKVE